MPGLLLQTVVLVWIKYSEDNIFVMATIKVQQIRSRIHAPHNQKATLDTLGFRKLNQVVEVEDTPSNRGLINTVHHLVRVID